MYRKVENKFEEWRKSLNRLPLIVQGARQVGKTYSVVEFGKKNYGNILYINFESNNELHKVFERDLNPVRIIRELSAMTGENVNEQSTLLFFDEVPSCSRALTSLKYFAEEAPGYSVVAAGSLLGVSINRDASSYPVGKVSTLTMYPFDFEEFLYAERGKEAAGIIRESFEQFTPCSLHDTFTDLFRTFLYTGGMPQVVQEYLNSGEALMTDIVKKNISDAYIADMARYATRAETVRILAVYKSIPSQLAKENHKFQYKVIKSGARMAEYSGAVDWLKAAGIVTACNRVSEGRLPLAAYADNTAFKLYHSDTGLLTGMTGLSGKNIMSDTGSSFRGAIAENSVAVSLAASGYTPYYWESQGRAEVDFVIQHSGDVIPLEVKAATNVRSRSLYEYIKRYSPPFSYRISEKNFGNENNIRSIPFYALFCI
jgi:predicted AAA+ superfamily ATPase